jgi:hypothetical protein
MNERSKKIEKESIKNEVDQQEIFEKHKKSEEKEEKEELLQNDTSSDRKINKKIIRKTKKKKNKWQQIKAQKPIQGKKDGVKQ